MTARCPDGGSVEFAQPIDLFPDDTAAAEVRPNHQEDSNTMQHDHNHTRQGAAARAAMDARMGLMRPGRFTVRAGTITQFGVHLPQSAPLPSAWDVSTTQTCPS